MSRLVQEPEATARRAYGEPPRKGSAMRLFLAAASLLLLPAVAAAQGADFGDAPDATNDPQIEAYPGTPAGFPTLLASAYATPGNAGAHHLTVDEEWLAERLLTVPGTTTETDAAIVDNDLDDAVVRLLCVAAAPPPGPFVPLPPICYLHIDSIHLGAGSPDVPRYVNALVDLDRDGRWESALPFGTYPREHIIVNKMITLAPGENVMVQSGPFAAPGPLTYNLPAQMWVRVTLTRSPISLLDADADGIPDAGWDGSAPAGGFAFGETEDHLLTPETFTGKEPATSFALTPSAQAVVLPGGGVGVSFWVDVVRRRAPSPYETPTTLFITTFDRCTTWVGTPGVDVVPAGGGPGPTATIGAVNDDIGRIRHRIVPLNPAPVPEATANYTADYDATSGPLMTRCWVKLAVDPNEEVVEYDYPFNSELPIHFLLGGIADGDGDGIPDLMDRCTPVTIDLGLRSLLPLHLEDLDGYRDDDGCLDPDNDGDGVEDGADLCPMDLEDLDGLADDDGCPDPETPLFADDFEHGGLSHWGSSTPDGFDSWR